MNGKTARLLRKIARHYRRPTREKQPEQARCRFWKRAWRALNQKQRRTARGSWAHDANVRLPA